MRRPGSGRSRSSRREAALTRTGKAGIAQVDTNGLVAAAFDHPDSRTGDPNLHTHVAVSAKVQGLDGAWRALDMRVLHAMAVAASETYNTAVEDELRTRLGVRFVERAAGRGKRPVREIDGIPAGAAAGVLLPPGPGRVRVRAGAGPVPGGAWA